MKPFQFSLYLPHKPVFALHFFPATYSVIHQYLSSMSSSVQFSYSAVSDSLWPHRLPHSRLPCPSPIPGVYSNSCPLSRWCHPTISSSVVPFSFPSIWVFSNESVFASGGQSFGVSASASVLPMNIQDWFSLGWTGWISLQSKGLSRVFSSTTVQKHFQCSAFFIGQVSHPYMTTGKTIALIRQTFAGEVMSLLFNMLTRLVIAFLPKSKCLGLISWLQSPSAVISEPKKIKSVTVSIASPSICHEVMGPGTMIFIFFECWVLSQLFHPPLASKLIVMFSKSLQSNTGLCHHSFTHSIHLLIKYLRTGHIQTWCQALKEVSVNMVQSLM